MAIIYTYPTKATLALGDLVLISDSADGSKTKNATMSSIKDVINVVDTFTSSFGTYITGTSNTSATGAVSIGTLNLSAVDGTAVSGTRFLSKDNTWDVPALYTGEDNLGFVPAGGTGTTFLKGDGTWGTGAGGVTSVTALTASDRGIKVLPTTGDVKVGINILTLTDLSTGALGSDLLFVVDDPSGTPINKKVTIDNLISTAGLITNSSINYTVKLPNISGSANQALKLPSVVGAGSNQLVWGDVGPGTGTASAIPYWETTSTLGSSIITQPDPDNMVFGDASTGKSFNFQNNKITFANDATNTFIKANTQTPESLEIRADQDIIINPDRYVVMATGAVAPTNNDDSGDQGSIVYDDNYLYVCVQDDTWKRVALSTW